MILFDWIKNRRRERRLSDEREEAEFWSKADRLLMRLLVENIMQCTDGEVTREEITEVIKSYVCPR